MASPNDNIRADASIGSGPNDSFDFYLETDTPEKAQAETDIGSNPKDPANNSESSVYLWLLGESLTKEQKQQAVAMERELPASVKKFLTSYRALSEGFSFEKLREFHLSAKEQDREFERRKAVPEGLVEAAAQISTEGGTTSDELVCSRMLENKAKEVAKVESKDIPYRQESLEELSKLIISSCELRNGAGVFS